MSNIIELTPEEQALLHKAENYLAEAPVTFKADSVSTITKTCSFIALIDETNMAEYLIYLEGLGVDTTYLPTVYDSYLNWIINIDCNASPILQYAVTIMQDLALELPMLKCYPKVPTLLLGAPIGLASNTKAYYAPNNPTLISYSAVKTIIKDSKIAYELHSGVTSSVIMTFFVTDTFDITNVSFLKFNREESNSYVIESQYNSETNTFIDNRYTLLLS